MIYDLIIIGGGPAGISAGVYAARKKLNTLLVARDFGGQSTVSDGIENWIGTIKISGKELAQNLRDHLMAYSGESLEIKEGEMVQDVKKENDHFVVITENNQYKTKTVLVATGSIRKKLDIRGAKEFDNKGLTYCASCDGPLFSGQDVVVIGGGNAAFETSAQLLAYCKSVTLLNRSDKIKADAITVFKLQKNPNFKIITNAIPKEIKGDQFVKSIVWQNSKTNEVYEIETPGIFVEIGLIPTTYFIKNILELNEFGQIPVDPRTQKTKVVGIWAAGDCTDGLYHQNNISSGDAVKALEDIYVTLHTK